MLKNKTKLLILLVSVFALLTTYSFATEPTVQPEEPTVTSEDSSNSEGTQPSEETTSEEQEVYSDDLYLFGDNVVMDKLVDGNVYIFANTVSVTGQVNGNLFVCAKDFSLSDAYVRNSIFLFVQTANLNGACTDLYAACNSMNVSYDSYIARDSRIGCDSLVFKGLNTRNMFVDASNIDFGSESEMATIYGNLTYTASSKLELPDGLVTGEVTYNPEEITDSENANDVMSIITSVLSALVYSIVVYFIIRWLTPKFEGGISEYASVKIVFACLIGIAAIILIFVVAFLLLFSSITTGLAVALFTIYALLLSIAFTVFCLFMTKCLNKKIKNMPQFGLFVIVTIVLALLREIPYISLPVSAIITATGFGMIIMSIFSSITKSNKKSVEVTATESTSSTEE